MKLALTLALAAASAALVSTPVFAAALPTTTTYYFEGNCRDCDPANTPATATLELQGYTPGEDLTSENFVRFTYHSNIQNFDSDGVVNGPPLFTVDNSLSGRLGATTGYYDVSYSQLVTFLGLFSAATTFETDTAGMFSYNKSAFNLPSLDEGNNGLWSLTPFTDDPAVPEPATWAMMIAGFGVVGAAMRRRKAGTRVTFA